MNWVIKANSKRYWSERYWSEGLDFSDPHWTTLEESTKYQSKEEAKKAAAFFHIIEPNIVEFL